MEEKMAWDVDVSYVGSAVFFKRGWARFIKDLSVNRGHFITFEYAGGVIFHVKIFLSNGCLAAFNLPEEDNMNTVQNTEIDTTSDRSDERGHHSEDGDGSERGVVPTFEIILQKSHIERCLHLPVTFWNEWVRKTECYVDAKLTVGEESWDVGITNRGSKIRLQRGWKRFMKDNNLSVGMHCRFELVDEEELHFRVIIE